MVELLLHYSLGFVMPQQATEDTYFVPRSINLPTLLITLVSQISHDLIQIFLLLALHLINLIPLSQMLLNLCLEVRKNL
jgi:hypothetical protein